MILSSAFARCPAPAAPRSLYLCDGSQNLPRAALGMHQASLIALPETSTWPGGWGEAAWQHLQAQGIEILQGGLGLKPQQVPQIGSGRIVEPHEALPLARAQQQEGLCATSIHLGTGLEDDAVLDRLAASVLDAVGATGHPMYVETHRATGTQDLWRTVQLVRRFPELRFNADLSHWYTGLEMAYGDWEAKLAFIDPVLERTAMLHGRIGNTCCMQIDIGDGANQVPQLLNPKQNFLEHFRQLWTACCRGFLRHAPAGSVLPFLPELILAKGYYARAWLDAQGTLIEEGDRYQQALVLLRIFRECFCAAQQSMVPDT